MNHTTLCEFEKLLTDTDGVWLAEEYDILYVLSFCFIFGATKSHGRCMEHSLHIAAKHFIKAVAPASLTAICKKVKAAIRKAKASGNLDLDEVDQALSDVDLMQDRDVDANDSDPDVDDTDSGDSDFSSGDSLRKAIALVKQVCSIYYIILFCMLTTSTDLEVPSGKGLLQGIMQTGWCSTTGVIALDPHPMGVSLQVS